MFLEALQLRVGVLAQISMVSGSPDEANDGWSSLRFVGNSAKACVSVGGSHTTASFYITSLIYPVQLS